jgi:hypothetical protein
MNRIAELLQEVTYANGNLDEAYLNKLTPEIETVTAQYPNNPDVITIGELVKEARRYIQSVKDGFFDDWLCSDLLPVTTA